MGGFRRTLYKPLLLQAWQLGGLLLIALVVASIVGYLRGKEACKSRVGWKPPYMLAPGYEGYPSPWWFVHYKPPNIDERAGTFSHYAQYSAARDKDPNGWADPFDKKTKSVSGFSSEYKNAEPFVQFLLQWMKDHNITSMVEASAGHWPSGWQSKVSWPPIKYLGVDLLQEMVDANSAFLRNNKAGFASFDTLRADMTLTPLPPADLLLTKDTLQHLPNIDIMRYLIRQGVLATPGQRRFKYIMIVNYECAEGEIPNTDVPPEEHASQCLDMAAEPFNLPVETVFHWGDVKVQLLTF
jgi:hypothetical protein